MARVVVTLRIMPAGTEIDLVALESKVKQKIVDFCASTEFKVSVEPIAFGLKSLNILFVMEESQGSTESLETGISQIEGVESVECTDVRRTIG